MGFFNKFAKLHWDDKDGGKVSEDELGYMDVLAPGRNAHTNPILAAKEADSTSGKIKAVLDPGKSVFRQKEREMSSADWERSDRRKKKKKKKPVGMKAGGRVTKCGVGGYYRKK